MYQPNRRRSLQEQGKIFALLHLRDELLAPEAVVAYVSSFDGVIHRDDGRQRLQDLITDPPLTTPFPVVDHSETR